MYVYLTTRYFDIVREKWDKKFGYLPIKDLKEGGLRTRTDRQSIVNQLVSDEFERYKFTTDDVLFVSNVVQLFDNMRAWDLCTNGFYIDVEVYNPTEIDVSRVQAFKRENGNLLDVTFYNNKIVFHALRPSKCDDLKRCKDLSSRIMARKKRVGKKPYDRPEYKGL